MADPSKTEPATAKKRKDERKKGNIPMSKDVITLVTLLFSFCVLRLLFPWMYEMVSEFLRRYISYTQTQVDITDSFILKISGEVVLAAVSITGPLIFGIFIISIAVTLAQTKMLFATEALKFKFDRMNPINGIKNLFSGKNFIEMLKSLVKIVILIVIMYRFFVGHLADFAKLYDMDIVHSAVYLFQCCFLLIMQISMAFLAITAFDIFYQRWNFERQMRMTKQEVKEEYKQTEGDPKVKGQIRAKQRKLAMSRMMQAVPEADVVIRNPTHFAVALKYDIEKDNAPLLVAKGQDALALRIVKTAEQHGIYVMENKPLARAIYASTEIGREVLPEYYSAIAEILVVVYKMKNKKIK